MKLILVSSLIVLSSCSLWRETYSRIDVESEDSPFTVKSLQGNQEKILGQTPLKIEPQKIIEITNDNHVLLSFTRPGFVEQRILLSTKDRDRHHIKVKLVPMKWWSDRLSTEARDIIEHVTGQTMAVQRLIKVKKFDEAEASLRNLLESYPKISHFHSLLGVVYYFKNDMVRAKSELKLATEFNSENREAQALLKKMEQIKQ